MSRTFMTFCLNFLFYTKFQLFLCPSNGELKRVCPYSSYPKGSKWIAWSMKAILGAKHHHILTISYERHLALPIIRHLISLQSNMRLWRFSPPYMPQKAMLNFFPGLVLLGCCIFYKFIVENKVAMWRALPPYFKGYVCHHDWAQLYWVVRYVKPLSMPWKVGGE